MNDQLGSPVRYRQVLSQYPTGVCVITALLPDGGLAAMVVGSFSSVSLNPPLVGFFPDKKSSSWARISAARRFCVNILSGDQEEICRKLASKDPDKLVGISYTMSERQSPVIDGVVAWIDCDLHDVVDAGDHCLVLGLVTQMEIARGGLPLLFYQGGYGRFAPASLVMPDIQGLLTKQLRIVDQARPEMERMAADLSAQCLASVRVGDELIVTASAGQAGRDAPASIVGQRVPFLPPISSLFLAWSPAPAVDQWLMTHATPGKRDAYRAALARVRGRGFSVGLLNEAQRAFAAKLASLAASGDLSPPAELADMIRRLDYDPPELSAKTWQATRLVSAPVFDASGKVALAFTIHSFPKPTTGTEMGRYVERLMRGAGDVTKLLGGRLPTN